MVVIGFLIAGILLNIASMILCVWASKIELYVYAIGHKIFHSDTTGFDTEELNIWKSLDNDEFHDNMIESYLNALKENDQNNFRKANKVKISQILFILGILTIPSIAIFLGSSISNETSLNDKRLELLYYKESGKVTNNRILTVSGNTTQVEISLASTGFINGTEIKSIKTISYLLETNKTISNGYGHGLINTPGRGMASYSINFSGLSYNGLVTLNGSIFFSSKAVGELAFIGDKMVAFKARIYPDNNFLLHSVI